jgi:hypothetical protein
MMALWIILGVIGAIGLIVLIMYVHLVWAGRKARAAVMRALEPVLRELRAGKAPQPELVQEAARNPWLRNSLHIILMFNKRLSLFPKQFLTWEAVAESEMVNWLCYPGKLGCPPDEMELMHKVPISAPDGRGDLHYFLFRFRMHPPHRFAQRGWVAGVTGPYDLSADPGPGGLTTLSRFEPYDSRTPQEHVELFHRLVGHKVFRPLTGRQSTPPAPPAPPP